MSEITVEITQAIYSLVETRPEYSVAITRPSYTVDYVSEIQFVDYEGYYTEEEVNALLDAKQDTLISATNIKTINSTSILGSGNIVVEGGGGGITLPIAQSDVTNLVTDLGNKVDKITGKELSANDFTNTLKSKLDNIESSANNYIHPASRPCISCVRKYNEQKKYEKIIE
jgi:hypothetical protein